MKTFIYYNLLSNVATESVFWLKEDTNKMKLIISLILKKELLAEEKKCSFEHYFANKMI